MPSPPLRDLIKCANGAEPMCRLPEVNLRL